MNSYNDPNLQTLLNAFKLDESECTITKVSRVTCTHCEWVMSVPLNTDWFRCERCRKINGETKGMI